MGTWIDTASRVCVQLPDSIGGARRDRTADLLHAMQALSQLSYGPTRSRRTLRSELQVVKLDQAVSWRGWHRRGSKSEYVRATRGSYRSAATPQCRSLLPAAAAPPCRDRCAARRRDR